MISEELAQKIADKIQSGPDLSVLPESHRAATKARLKWLATAGKHQIEPKGDWWTVWLLLAGRGAGKTRCASEWLWWQAWSNPGTRWLVSAPTSGDVRDVCFEGDSGLLSVVPR